MDLSGRAATGTLGAYDLSGKDIPIRCVVFPLFVLDARGVPTSVGTGFFVSPDGLFLTAGHVAQNIQKLLERAPGRPVAVVQLLNGQTMVRNVFKISRHPRIDIAVGIFSVHVDEQGNAVKNPQVALTTAPIPEHTKVHTYAFPKTETHMHEDRFFAVTSEADYFDGEITQFFPAGRGNRFPWKCYETSMHLHDGASGGPVFDDNGRVFALNNSSFDTFPDVSYVTAIDSILTLPLFDVGPPPTFPVVTGVLGTSLLQQGKLVFAPRPDIEIVRSSNSSIH